MHLFFIPPTRKERRLPLAPSGGELRLTTTADLSAQRSATESPSVYLQAAKQIKATKRARRTLWSSPCCALCKKIT